MRQNYRYTLQDKRLEQLRFFNVFERLYDVPVEQFCLKCNCLPFSRISPINSVYWDIYEVGKYSICIVICQNTGNHFEILSLNIIFD